MTDTAADAKKTWTFTKPADGKECYKDMKAFSDDKCATANADFKVVATMKVGDKE